MPTCRRADVKTASDGKQYWVKNHLTPQAQTRGGSGERKKWPLIWAGDENIADSGVFSASLSEVADPRYAGTALTALTAVGFGLTVVSIQLVPLLAEVVTCRYAFLLLVPDPVVGALAMLRTRS